MFRHVVSLLPGELASHKASVEVGVDVITFVHVQPFCVDDMHPRFSLDLGVHASTSKEIDLQLACLDCQAMVELEVGRCLVSWTRLDVQSATLTPPLGVVVSDHCRGQSLHGAS